jgi:hypothetical protein
MEKDRKNRRVKSSLLISILISLIAVGVILWFTMRNESIEELSRINPLYFFIALCIHISSWFIWSTRIKILTGASGGNLAFKDILKIVMTSIFVAGITPSHIGGEPARIYLLNKKDMSVGDATAVTLSERFMDLIFLLLMLPIGLFIFRDIVFSEVFFMITLAFVTILLTVGIVLMAYLMYRPDMIKRHVSKLQGILSRFRGEERAKQLVERIKEEIDSFVGSIWFFIKSKKCELCVASLCTVAYWCMEFSVASVILIGLGCAPEILRVFVAQTILTIIVLVPLTPGSSGIAEFGFMALFSTFVTKPAVLGVFVIIWRVILYHVNLIAGGIASANALKDTKLIENIWK